MKAEGRRMKDEGRRRSGSATLELCLTLTILLNLTFGAVEFGHYFYVKNTLVGAAREGARAGITPTGVNSDVTSAVSSVMTAAGLQGSGYTVTVNPSSITGLSTGSNVSVTVSCSWGTVGLRPLGIIGASKTVTGTAVMRRE